MGAVREPAVREEARHVVERLVESVVCDPELQLADAWRIDDQRAAGEEDQLATRRRVSAGAVTADLLRREQLFAREGVDERRLAHAGRAEKNRGQTGLKVFLHPVEPRARQIRERQHGHPSCDRLDLRHRSLGNLVKVGFRQHDHRPCPALPGQNEVALEPPQAEILVHRGNEECNVDVGCQYLLFGGLPGGLARELRVPRQDRGDRACRCFGSGAHDDPVADNREVGSCRCLVNQAARNLTAKLAEFRQDVVGAAMLHRDAAGNRVVAGERRVLAAQPVVPAERFKFGQAVTPFRPRVHESGARNGAPVDEARAGGRT